MATKAVVFFGPRKAFDKLVRERTKDDERCVTYLDSIRVYNARIKSSDLTTRDLKLKAPERVDSCIVHADDFGSVLSHVISSFAGILEETFEIGTLYVQNPPRRAFESIKASQPDGTLETILYGYLSIGKDSLSHIYSSLCADVLGQEEGKRAIVASLYRLSVLNNEKPSVVLLYGPSGVGKTETARCISRAVGGELTRIQFSMMQTQEAFEYLFGAEHSKASFARDLLARESNVILIDEFDKVDPRLYNMFYQLFDEGRYVDTNYDVDMRNGLFLLTTNFRSEAEAQRMMGPAIFSRINSCIEFSDLGVEEKVTIIRRHYNHIMGKLDEQDRQTIGNSDILAWFEDNARYFDNMRTMKSNLEKAIFTKLSSSIFKLRESTRC